jgi:hypothetical protein
MRVTHHSSGAGRQRFTAMQPIEGEFKGSLTVMIPENDAKLLAPIAVDAGG